MKMSYQNEKKNILAHIFLLSYLKGNDKDEIKKSS
jgi:hypothetical protein